MNKYTIIGFLLVFSFGCGQNTDSYSAQPKERSARELLMEINSDSRLLSIDEVSQRIIGNDPVLLLVDVRQPEVFSTFTLPGAINVPISKIFEDDFQEKLASQKFDVVFFR